MTPHENPMATPLSWSQSRLIAYRSLGIALLAVGGYVQGVTLDNAGYPWLVAFGVLAFLMAGLIVVDVVYAAWRGDGQACRHCGHVRKLKSFRFSSPCPQCGQG